MESVWNFVDRRMAHECWNWFGKLNEGTPTMIFEGKIQTARRLVWLDTHGEWPPAKVFVACGNRLCCNPSHIRLPFPKSGFGRKSSVPPNAGTGLGLLGRTVTDASVRTVEFTIHTDGFTSSVTALSPRGLTYITSAAAAVASDPHTSSSCRPASISASTGTFVENARHSSTDGLACRGVAVKAVDAIHAYIFNPKRKDKHA